MRRGEPLRGLEKTEIHTTKIGKEAPEKNTAPAQEEEAALQQLIQPPAPTTTTAAMVEMLPRHPDMEPAAPMTGTLGATRQPTTGTTPAPGTRGAAGEPWPPRSTAGAAPGMTQGVVDLPDQGRCRAMEEVGARVGATQEGTTPVEAVVRGIGPEEGSDSQPAPGRWLSNPAGLLYPWGDYLWECRSSDNLFPIHSEETAVRAFLELPEEVRTAMTPTNQL